MTNDHAASAVTGGMFEAIDSKDATAFVGYLTEDAVFCFGSASPATGRAAIQVAVDGLVSCATWHKFMAGQFVKVE